jgi:hypothetical protein
MDLDDFPGRSQKLKIKNQKSLEPRLTLNPSLEFGIRNLDFET